MSAPTSLARCAWVSAALPERLRVHSGTFIGAFTCTRDADTIPPLQRKHCVEIARPASGALSSLY